MCGCATRTRVLWWYLAGKSAPALTGADILHFAPEEPLCERIVSRRPRDYVTVDLRRPDVSLRADICDLPLENARFDLVICSHVLEHIPDDRRAMRELARVCAPGGIALIQVPMTGGRETFEDSAVVDPRERKRLFGEPDHLRLYGTDIADKLRDAGFEVSELCVGSETSETERSRAGLGADQVLFLCRPARTPAT
jgi:SAM-dependent methyltransferase